ncbi:hypothetical protein CALCODRAFT_513621, partial [Calocera cornea HHB12733]
RLQPGLKLFWEVYVRVWEIVGPTAWSNNKGSGKRLEVYMKDAENNLMKAIVFEAAKMQDVLDNIREGDILRVSNVEILPLKQHFLREGMLPYEMRWTSSSVTEVELQSHGVPEIDIPTTSVDQIPNAEMRSRINLLAVIFSMGQITEFVKKQRVASTATTGRVASSSKAPDSGSKQEKSTQKRLEVNITCRSKHIIRMTLWDARATSFKGRTGQVILVTDAVVVPHGGISLNAYANTVIKLDPKVKDAKELKVWFRENVNNGKFFHLSAGYSATTPQPANAIPRTAPLTLEHLDSSPKGVGAKVESFNIEERIIQVDYDFWNRNVEKLKEVVKTLNIVINRKEKSIGGIYRMHLTLGTNTKPIRVTAFSPVADLLVGEPPEELVKYRDHMEGQFQEYLKKMLKTKWRFTIQARTSQWQPAGSIEYINHIDNHITGAVQLDDDD